MRKKMRWRAELADVLAARATAFTRCWNTATFGTSSGPHGLPPSRRQVRVVIDGRVVYRDAYYEKYSSPIELDGRDSHPDDERWRDHRRDIQAAARSAIVTYRRRLAQRRP